MDFSIVQPFVRSVSTTKFTWRNPYPSVAYDSRLFYIMSGSGTVTIEGKTYPLSQGVMLIIPPGTPYFFDFDDKDMFTLFTINFDFTMQYSHHKEWINVTFEPYYDEALCYRCTTPPIFKNLIYLTNMKDFQSTLLSMLQEFRNKSMFFYEKIASLLKAILIDIARRVDTQTNDIPKILEDLFNYIYLHYSEDINYDSIQEALSYHPYYLNRCLKEATGKTISRYLLEHRLSVAKGLMNSTDMPIEEVGYATGFKSPSHFSSSFKTVYGISPRKYREMKFKLS